MRNTVKLFGFLALMGLLASCNNQVEGEKVEATETQEVVQDAEAKTLTVDVATAKMEWLGSKVTGKHNGTVNIKSGSLMVKGTELVGGSFIIDMNSITVTDLKENEGKSKLEKHLKEKDFFEADKFPEGKFEITGVKAEAGENGATHKVSGNLTLKDKSFGVEIPATITMENGAATISTPQFVINRQNWGINFTGQKDNLISNDMGIKLNFTAK
jgi:polyisoprenoid-binding protein YceI